MEQYDERLQKAVFRSLFYNVFTWE